MALTPGEVPEWDLEQPAHAPISAHRPVHVPPSPPPCALPPCSHHLVARVYESKAEFRSALQHEKEGYTIYKTQVGQGRA